MRWFELATFCALTLVPVAAFAEITSKPKPIASSAAAASSSADAKTRETADQKKRRADYTSATTKRITSVTKKKQTTEMKALVKKHWRTALRLLGVQRVAENQNKPAVAKKAADTLAKEDTRFFAKLEQLAKAAASDGGAK